MAVRLEPATGASGDSEATPSDREGGQRGDRRWSTIKRQWPAALCFAVYVVLAMVVYGHFGSLGPGHMTGTIYSGHNRPGLVARVDRIRSPSRPQRLRSPVAELSSG